MELVMMLSVVIIVIINCITNIVAFLIGAKTVQKADKGEEIKFPTINPVKAYQEHMEEREAKKEQEELEINMYNIDNYKGDGTGQKNFK